MCLEAGHEISLQAAERASVVRSFDHDRSSGSRPQVYVVPRAGTSSLRKLSCFSFPSGGGDTAVRSGVASNAIWHRTGRVPDATLQGLILHKVESAEAYFVILA